MMSEQTDNITKFLKSINLTEVEIRIYLFLVGNKPQTALSISKHLNVGRTKVYRILDRLYKKDLVDQVVGSRGYLFETKPFENLQQIVVSEEEKLRNMQLKIPQVITDLKSMKKVASEMKNYKVKYYEGVEGLKQENRKRGGQ